MYGIYMYNKHKYITVWDRNQPWPTDEDDNHAKKKFLYYTFKIILTATNVPYSIVKINYN